MPYRQHLKGKEDLVTTHEAIRSGFVAMALERGRKSTPAVVEAHVLRHVASMAPTPKDMLGNPRLRQSLLAAAGYSEKAVSHISPDDVDEILREFVHSYLEPAEEQFVEEFVFRFLLTKGDSIGGVLRNLAGRIAMHKLTEAVLGALRVEGVTHKYLHGRTKRWTDEPAEGVCVDDRISAVWWESNGQDRVLAFNRRLNIVEKNIDLCLLRSSMEAFVSSQQSPSLYLALGELKGGIDPAGSDEHWKTAGTALARVRSKFAAQQLHPAIFVVAAAIVPSMADDIWTSLRGGTLANAANLNSSSQLGSLVHWLIGL